ncbi:ParB family chromosome partitioning protein [Desulfitispora alkaliphila]|uniref:ParB/RepB/Spo0J family partition protein n=1 Tax=Desulfitispora alkaliphila TaxID=622674 RepID=UPI003D1E1715
MSKRGLGRGLSAILSTGDEVKEELKDSEITKLEIKNILKNPFQPRTNIDNEGLEELANSIKEHGIVQPIAVRTKGTKYELIAGERRLRAAKMAGLSQIPAVIISLDDRQMAEVAIIENIQRENLNAMDEAFGFHRLVKEFAMTQEEVAKRVGKSRPYIANMLRLTNLPPLVQEMVRNQKLSAGHARAILAIDKPEDQGLIIQQIIDKNLSVRQTEELVKNYLDKSIDEGKCAEKQKQKHISPELQDIEELIRQALGTKVAIKPKDKKGKKGKIEIEYYSTEDLDRIMDLILKEKNII